MASLKKQFKREYDALKWAIRWCTDPTHRNWPWYRGRGITVCPQWMNSFEQFLKDVGPKPKHSRVLWLGRLDVNKGYEPGNVAWLPHQRQIAHRRYCHRMQLSGKDLTLAEMDRELGLPGGTLRNRILLMQMPVDRAITPGKLPFKKTSQWLTYNGETLSYGEWAKRIGLSREALRYRLKSGWPLERALRPVNFRNLKASDR